MWHRRVTIDRVGVGSFHVWRMSGRGCEHRPCRGVSSVVSIPRSQGVNSVNPNVQVQHLWCLIFSCNKKMDSAFSPPWKIFFVRINEMGLIKHLGEKHCIDHCIWMMLLRQLLWNRKNKAPCAVPRVYLSILPLPGLGLLYPQATIWPLWIHWTVSQLKQVPAGEREDRCRLPVPRHLRA